MKSRGIFVAVLLASCFWNWGFAEGYLYHIKKPADALRICTPEGISADGATVVGKARENPNWEAFRWNPRIESEPFLILPLAAGKTSTGSAAYDVTEHGRIIVGEGSWNNADHNFPKIWIEDTMVPYNVDFGGSQYLGAVAYAISDDGSIIATKDAISPPITPWTIPVAHWWNFGADTPPNYDPAQRPAAGNFVDLPIYVPPGSRPSSEYTGSRPIGISGKGSVIVGISEIHTNGIAVQWEKDVYNNWVVKEFGTWDENWPSNAVAASFDGGIVVGNMTFNIGTEQDPDWQWRGFVWDTGSKSLRMLRTLTFEEAGAVHDFTEAFDISGDGTTIVGRSGFGNITESIAVYWDVSGKANKFEELVDEAVRKDWQFEGISAVNHDGSSMAGFGKYDGNLAQAWHLHKAYDDGYSNSEDKGADWYHNQVIGVFWRAGKSHVWHNQHGWQMLAKGKHEILLFDYGSDSWLWTSEIDYPYMYRFGTNPGWTYYQEGGSPGDRVFYHFGQELWMTETELAGGS